MNKELNFDGMNEDEIMSAINNLINESTEEDDKVGIDYESANQLAADATKQIKDSTDKICDSFMKGVS
jgi:hypothetical protein